MRTRLIVVNTLSNVDYMNNVVMKVALCTLSENQVNSSKPFKQCRIYYVVIKVTLCTLSENRSLMGLFSENLFFWKSSLWVPNI